MLEASLFSHLLIEDLRITKSQAVARLADRTASQHLLGSRDIIGHVTSW